VVFSALVHLSHRLHGMGSYTFEGRWESLVDVPCGVAAYDEVILARKIVASRRANLEAAVAGEKELDAMIDDNGRTILPLVAACYVSRSAPLSIIDFGGGLGVGLVSLLNHLPDIRGYIAAGKLNYVIVETPSMCTAVEEVFEEIVGRDLVGPRVFWRICRQLPAPGEVGGPVGILNMASVLQYIDPWRELLKALVQLRPRHIIISETPVTRTKTYARMQCNMPNRRLATWVFNHSELLDELGRHGYTARFTTKHDLPLRIADEPSGFPSRMTSFVFERTAS